MGRNKSKPGNVKQESTVTQEQSTSSSSTLLKRYYGYEHLAPALQTKIKQTHVVLYDELLKKLIGHSPETVPRNLRTEVESAITEFEELFALLTSDEKLKNLKDDYFNSDYLYASYCLKLGSLNFYLGKREKAQSYCHKGLTECSHPFQIKIYWFMQTKKLFREDVAIRINYQMRLIQSVTALSGNSAQRKAINEIFNFLNFTTKEEGLIAFTIEVFDFYTANNKHQEIELLLATLSPSSSLVPLGKALLQTYIQPFLERSEFAAVKRMLLHFDKLADIDHYANAGMYVRDQLDKDNRDIERNKLYIHFLEKGCAFGNVNSMVNLAAWYIYQGDEVLNEKNVAEKGLKLTNEVLGLLAKSTEPDAKLLKGICYHLLGRIVDLGLVPNHPGFKQSDSQALKFYTIATESDYEDAYQDLASLYQSGQGTKQDLEKADSLLRKAASTDKTGVHMSLAVVQWMRLTTAPNSEAKARLVQEGLAFVDKVMNAKDPSFKAQALFTRACILFADDTKILPMIDAESQKILSGFNTAAIAGYVPTGQHKYVAEVKNAMNQSATLGNVYAQHFLGLLHQLGNYLSEDLLSAEVYYSLCTLQGKMVAEEYAGLYLLQSSRAVDIADRQKYLLKALTWHRKLLDRVTSISKKELLEEHFSLYMKAYVSQSVIPSKRSFLSQSHTAFSSSEKRLSVDKKLSQAIRAVETHLLELGKCNANFECTLIDLLFKLTQIIQKSKNQVPEYLEQLKNLFSLQEQLQLNFLNLSIQARIDLIKLCSKWPLVSDKKGPLAAMLILTRPEELTPLQRVSLVLAITQMRHTEGLFEDDLRRFLFKKVEKEDLKDISIVARLIYIYAITHVNEVKESSYIKDLIFNSQDLLINYINDHCWEANTEDMSQIYHALYYLQVAYPTQFSILPDKLNDFMNINSELLKKDDAVTISERQQQVYNLLESMDSGFLHEAFVGGRRVDFYNPRTKEIVFYHGPCHYLFSSDGIPSIINPRTVFCEKMLEKQGFTVVSIDYLRWSEATNKSQQIDLLKSIVPSLKSWKPAEEKSKSPASGSTTPKIGKSGANFWSKEGACNGEGVCNNNVNLVL